METGFVCCNCGEDACSRVRKKDEDGEEMFLYYCKNCLRGHKSDESFFG